MKEVFKAFVVINQGHTLFPDQEKVLNDFFGKGTWDFLKVPEKGWTYEEILEELNHS